MKRIIITAALAIFSSAAAQESLPIYQQYLLGGNFLINPAYYGSTDGIVADASYQKQFSKFDQSPNVQSIGLHANIFDRVGAGLSFFRDQNGPVSANGITAGASYFIPLSDDGTREDQFSFGTGVNFYNMNIDYTQVHPAQNADPELYSGANSIFMVYANLGAQFSYRGFFGGLSVVDIPLSNDAPEVNGIEPSPTKYLLNAGYSYSFSEGMAIEPSLLLNLNSNSAKMLDLNLLAKFYNDSSLFAAGLSFRSATDKTGTQQLSISPIIKAKFGNFHFGAAYGFGISGISTYGGNSFMLSLGYDFENFINGRGFRYR